jgi:hypothetical protein
MQIKNSITELAMIPQQSEHCPCTELGAFELSQHTRLISERGRLARPEIESVVAGE